MRKNHPTAPDVQHNEAECCFEICIGEAMARLDYELDAGRVVMTHTFVPAELRGRGLAEQLVRVALAWVRTRGGRVVPACSYVATFIERHAEFKN